MKEAYVFAPNTSRALAVAGEAPASGRSLLADALGTKEHARGDVLAGKYRIIGPLGAGGMGTVWRAHSLWLDIDVAVKVLHREQVDVLGAERLLREARATARLGHPSIVRVFDFGETDAGQPFLVMELLEGISLASWLDTRGRMSAPQAVQMLLPVASALVAAHAQGIVHRDIKPANIIAVLDETGTYVPKVVDFGIAKLAKGSGRALTQMGTIIGSPEYMSPEQANGMLEVGEQTDVWALCVVLYELITGQRPFAGQTLSAIISAVFHQHPTPVTEFAAGDEELWELIERGLKKSPADRWPSMRALGRALASWAAQRGITTDAAGMSLSHQWLATESAPMLSGGSHSAASAVRAVVVSAASATVRRLTVARAPIAETPAPSSDPSGGAGFGTVKMAYTSTDARSEVAPRPWRRRALFLGVVAAFVGPVVVALGLRVSSGNAEPSAIAARPAGASELVTLSSAMAAPAMPASIDIAPTEAPSAAASGSSAAAARASQEPDRRAAPVARQKLSERAMPLPTTPDF